MVSGGDAAVVLKDGKNAKAGMKLLEYLAPPKPRRVAKAGGFLSPNKKLDLASYGDDVTRATAKSLVAAGDSVRFDMSDQAPAAFGVPRAPASGSCSRTSSATRPTRRRPRTGWRPRRPRRTRAEWT